MKPGGLVFFNGSLPVSLVFINRNAEYLKPFILVFIVECFQVFIGPAARSTPAGPEINDHHFSYQRRKRHHFSTGIFQADLRNFFWLSSLCRQSSRYKKNCSKDKYVFH